MKESLNKRISKHDYSYLEWHQADHIFPLKDRIHDTGEYHRIKQDEALENLNRLISLKVSEYFMFLPACINELKRLPPFYDCEDLEDMDVGELFQIIGNIDDYSETYTSIQATAEVCWIFFKVIVDSGFTHPYLRSSFWHFTNSVWEKTQDELCCINDNRVVLRNNMNDHLRNLINKHYDDYIREDDRIKDVAFRLFFNYIVRSALILRKHVL